MRPLPRPSSLDAEEVDEVLAQYNGGDFDGKEFMQLYDNDGKADQRLNSNRVA